MQPPHKKNLRIAAGFLAAWGLLSETTPCVASPQAPAADPPATIVPASDLPSGPAATPLPKSKPTNDGPPTVLLRTSGRVLQGEILRDANGYILKNRFGVAHFARRDVEATFRSMEELYAYKLSLCPPDDPDERMKLATWCLEQKLKPEAKTHLEAVLEISPGNSRAKAMLANLDPPASIAPKDDGVIQTNLKVPMADSPPSETQIDRLRDSYAKNPRAAGLPAIFDLETPLAVRRYQEFVAKVHPLLQRRCANCHNENTPGEFQLIQTRTKKDATNDLITRSNLESTLLIISREDLTRSPILTAAGMTHGNGGKPVLGGPASPEYRILAAWVTSLKPPGTKAPTLNSPPSGIGPSNEQFASGRTRPNSDPAMPPPTSQVRRPKIQVEGDLIIPPDSFPGVVGAMPEADPSADFIDGSKAMRPGRLIPGSEVGMPGNAPPDDQFQTKPIRKNDRNPIPDPAEPGKIDPAGPKMIRLPSGEMVEYMSRDAVARKKTDPTKKSALDLKKLDDFRKARTPTKP